MEKLGSPERVGQWMLGGFLTMFFLQRFFHFHHHDVPEAPGDCCHDHHLAPAGKPDKGLSWLGTTVGLTLHSLFDGMALAASVVAGAQGHIAWAGICVALAVILHKPFDAMAISTLTTINGKSKRFRHITNALFSAATPAGMCFFYACGAHFVKNEALFLGSTLAFCAGNFLCIAGSDLLPELQFHSHDRWKLSFALMTGVALAVIIGLLGG
jgi:zinc and cadmium transporter